MNIAVVSSSGQCGIHECSLILVNGLRELGHRAHYIAVQRHDNDDLRRRIREVQPDDQLVIFEYEPGIFWLGGLIRAMALLRFWRRKRLVLSVHEIAADKFPEFRRIQWQLERAAPRGGLRAIFQLGLSTIDVAWRFAQLRLAWLLLGWLSHIVIVHSIKGEQNIRLILPPERRVHQIPLAIPQLQGDREALRRKLGLPTDRFAFITPGFLFRRKRIVECIEQLPPDAELWVVGAESDFDPGYLAEIEAYLAQSEKRQRVRLDQDYGRLEDYLLAADVVVMFYAEGYQSAVASQAIGAGKPCIFSDLPAFSDLQAAGLTVRTPAELRQAMQDIQGPAVYARLVEAASEIRQRLSPARIAAGYLDTAASEQ